MVGWGVLSTGWMPARSGNGVAVSGFQLNDAPGSYALQRDMPQCSGGDFRLWAAQVLTCDN